MHVASYQYLARTAGGEEVAGVLQAENEAAAARALDDKKLFPVRIEEQAVVRTARRQRVRLRDVGVFYGQLSDLLGAGVPLLRALDILIRVGVRRQFTEVLGDVRERVAGGEPLADAMAAHPHVFASLHVAMVRAGERAGFLEQALANLTGFIERQDELRSKVHGALIYPVVLTVLGVVMVTGILMFLVPRFRGLLEGVALPMPTQLLFGLSDLLVHNWPVVLGMLVMVTLGLRAYVQSASGRRTWESWRMRLPVLGGAMRMVAITRFCRVLGTMLDNGVPILQALAISKDATGSLLMAVSIDEAAENVRAGAPLAEPLKRNPMFPAEIAEMIAIGEESNQLEKVLVQVADTVERRTNRQVDQAVRLIEPLILILLAAVIAFVAIGLLYPVFTMAGNM